VSNKGNSYDLEAEYRQPLLDRWFLDLGYEYSRDDRENSKLVMDFDEASGRFTLFNETLSSDFNFESIQQTPSIGVRKRGDNLNLRFGASYTFTDLNNRDFLQNTSFSRSFKNLLFTGRLRYSLGKNKRFYASYRSRLNLPSVNQLQPVPNVNDPLNIVIGNPDLSPAVNHGINFNYDNYNWKERTGIYVYSNIDIEKNRVSAISTTDENLLRTTRFINIDGNYDGSAGFGYSKEIKKDSTFSANFNVRPNLRFGRQVSFTNGTELKARSFDVSPYFSTTLNFRELVEFEPGYGITFNTTRYNLENIDDVKYTSQNFNVRLTTYWPENLVWGNDIRYTYNGNVSPGFRKDALFWNMSLGLDIFDKKATVKVLAYDLLNQNTNVRRTTGEDFIQDFQGTVLQRYFMGSFTYKFDQFGGAKKKGGRNYRR